MPDCSTLTLTLPQRPLITLNQKTGIKTAKIGESLFQLLADNCSQPPRKGSGFRLGRAWTNIASRTAVALYLMSCSCGMSRGCLQMNTSETNSAISVSILCRQRNLFEFARPWHRYARPGEMRHVMTTELAAQCDNYHHLGTGSDILPELRPRPGPSHRDRPTSLGPRSRTLAAGSACQ